MVHRIILSVALSSAVLLAQPVVTSAVNAAGYMKAGLPNGGIAQGSFIAIFGTNIGPAVPAGGIAVSGYPLQPTFSGISAKLGGKDLFIVYASPTQAGAVVPSDTPLGNQPLTLTFNGQTSALLTVQVVQRAFGMFTLNQGGSGPVVGLKFISQSSQPPSTLLEAMNPGGTITLFGTGMGASSNPDNQTASSSAVTGLTANDIEVLIGGKRAPIQFFGRSSCCSAIDQIVADIPADVTPGCYVSLVVRVGGVTSNATTISIAPQGESVCSDPGLTKEQIQTAASKGTFSAGALTMAKIATDSVLGAIVTDSANAAFYRYDLNQLVRSQGVGGASISLGSCNTYSFTGQDSTNVDPVRPTGLDAGASITLNNPLGTQTLEKVQNQVGLYSKTVLSGSGFPAGTPGIGPEFLTTGNHTYTGPGGAQVEAFNTSLNWPAAFNWTNKAAITAVPRSSPLTINWSGGDPQGSVYIFGYSATGSGNNTVGAGFFCLAPATPPTFSVPAAILSSLPPSASVAGTPTGYLTVYGMSKTGTFTATGLDYGVITYQAGSGKSVGYN